MASNWQVHELTNGSDKWYFLSKRGQYTGVGTTCGVAEVADTDEVKLSKPLCTVEALLGSAAAVRKSVRYKVGSKTKYGSVICSAAKADTFDTDIVGKSYNGSTIQDAYTPRRASFR